MGDKRPAGGPGKAGDERFRLAWEMAADAMVLSDGDGVVVAANRAYLDLYGYTAEQVIGHSFAIIFPAAVRAWAVEEYRRVFAAADPPPAVESEIERADGTLRMVESTVGYITEGGQRTAMLSIIRDITGRKQLEVGLRSAHMAAERAAQRLARLQAVTEAFSHALTSSAVTRIILEQGLPAVGAVAGLVMLVSADGTALEMAAHQGYDPAAVESWPRIPLHAPLPMAEAARTRQPLLFHNQAELHARFRPTNLEPPEHVAWAVLPLAVEERVMGALGLSFAEPQAFDTEERAVLRTLAGQCAQALERARLYALEQSERARLEEQVAARTGELLRAKESLEAEIAARQLVEQQMEQAREHERARLARELHDGLGGALTGLKLDLARLRRTIPANLPEWDERLVEMLGVVDDTVVVMRRIASDLRPAVLDDLGLADALAWQVDELRRRSGLACHLVLEAAATDLEPHKAIAVYRIVQEALTNVLRHAQATSVEVRLSEANERLRLSVADNGQGLAPGRANNSTTLGLAGMRERVRLLGGTLAFESAAGVGTTVRVEIPTRS